MPNQQQQRHGSFYCKYPSRQPFVPTEVRLAQSILLLQNSFARMDQRSQQWGSKASLHFLSWWISEMERVTFELTQRGQIELEREDATVS